MEERERENARRAARGGPPLPMPDEWTDRPVMNEAEHRLFVEFTDFARFCGGDPRPTDARAWFEMRGVQPSEQEWMASLFSAMSAPLRERGDSDGET